MTELDKPPSNSTVAKHPPEDRCFYCMSEATFQKAWAGEPHPTIHMSLPAEACPDFRPEDWEVQP